ncbi:uncharacterized protein LOC143348890 [Colletes latitarsis]|uniref:uncharacterized protein LOC143348890 n=1 Tax=Colletes latitarsis TaxID=2605962 RepID=UPI004035C6BA
MRDTSNMMEDALSEDTMMDCGGDGGGLEDLVDLATDVADSSPTIREAAERLLTLLGMEDENEDLLSSSEDEGVDLDADELDEEEEELENTRLLHQLAASLAEELKQSHQKQNPIRVLARSSFDRDRMDLAETSYTEHGCLQDQEVKGSRYRETVPERCQRQDSSRSFAKEHGFTEFYECLDHRLRMDSEPEDVDGRQEQVPTSWGAGWDACAAEALRYLVEDEGLPPHHPTVLAMKDHLETQRERTFAQYTA